MTDPDDAEPKHEVSPRFDNWPVEREMSAEHEQVDHDATEEVAEEYLQEEADENIHWLGYAHSGVQGTSPYLYDSSVPAVYEGEVDDENERVILKEHSRREIDSEESLGEHVERIGEEHGWAWLASFARDHLESDEKRPARRDDGLELRDTEFNRRNVAESVAYDLSFSGRHTFVDESNRVRIIDRQFNVYLDGDGPESRVFVDIDEDYLLAEEPLEESSAGDTDNVDKRRYEFEIDVDTDELGWEGNLEESVWAWHVSHADWPKHEE